MTSKGQNHQDDVAQQYSNFLHWNDEKIKFYLSLLIFKVCLTEIEFSCIISWICHPKTSKSWVLPIQSITKKSPQIFFLHIIEHCPSSGHTSVQKEKWLARQKSFDYYLHPTERKDLIQLKVRNPIGNCRPTLKTTDPLKVSIVSVPFKSLVRKKEDYTQECTKKLSEWFIFLLTRLVFF